MHIPDGYLSPETYIPATVGFVPLALYAYKRVKKTVTSETLPFLSSLTALSFVIMMFNIPIPGGTSGHAIGAAAIAILFGPWAGFLSLSIVLFIQALVFGDGGITSFPINAFSMGFVASFTASAVYSFLKNHFKNSTSAFWAGWASLVMAALSSSIFLGIQPLIATDSNGHPLFFPFNLTITIPAMVGSHILFFGVVEGIFTTLTLGFVQKMNPEFLSRPIQTFRKRDLAILGFFLSALFLLVPLGLLTRYPAWGEWTSDTYTRILGFIPEGMRKFSEIYTAPLSDYSLKSVNPVSAYYLSALIGIGLIFFFSAILFRQFRRPEKSTDQILALLYVSGILFLTLTSTLYIILAVLFFLFLLSFRQFPRHFKRAFLIVLFFNSIVTVFYILYASVQHTSFIHFILLINLRTFTLTYLTLLFISKINLFAVFSFSSTLTYLLTISYGQILSFRRIFNDFRFSLKSRMIKKPKRRDIYAFISSTAFFFMNKSLNNSKEIFQAMQSRGFLND